MGSAALATMDLLSSSFSSDDSDSSASCDDSISLWSDGTVESTSSSGSSYGEEDDFGKDCDDGDGVLPFAIHDDPPSRSLCTPRGPRTSPRASCSNSDSSDSSASSDDSISLWSDGTAESAISSESSYGEEDDFGYGYDCDGEDGVLPFSIHDDPPARSPPLPPRAPLRSYDGALSTIEEEGAPKRDGSLVETPASAHESLLTSLRTQGKRSVTGQRNRSWKPSRGERQEVDLWGGGSASRSSSSFSFGRTDFVVGGTGMDVVEDSNLNLIVDFQDEDLVDFWHNRSGNAIAGDSRGWCVRHPHVRGLPRRSGGTEELPRRCTKNDSTANDGGRIVDEDASDGSSVGEVRYCGEEAKGDGGGKCANSMVTRGTLRTSGSYDTAATEPSNESGGDVPQREGPVRVFELQEESYSREEDEGSARTNPRTPPVSLITVRLVKQSSPSRSGSPGTFRLNAE